MKLFKPPGCVRFVCTDIHPDVINLNDNLPFSMKLIPLEQSVINVAKPYIVIAGIWALAKKQLEMITVQSHRRPPPHPLLPLRRSQPAFLVGSFHYHNKIKLYLVYFHA